MSPFHLHPRWSRRTAGGLGGLALAREPGLLLAWDDSHHLYVWDLSGHERSRHRLVVPLATAAISDDGQRIVAATERGQLFWFDAQLQLLYDQSLDVRPVAIALDAFGQYLLISDRERRTQLITRWGPELAEVETPRPLQFLAFIPGRTAFVGAADFGYVGCFDSSGRSLWREAPVSHIGSLMTDGEGQHVAVACFSDGLVRYDAKGHSLPSIPTPTPCRRAAMSYDGSYFLAAGELASLSLLHANGSVLGSIPLSHPAQGVVLGALGDFGAYALPDGEVTLIDIKQDGKP